MTKAKGCLELRSARNTNMALLAKESWNIITGESNLWVETFRKKYLKRTSLLEYNIKDFESNAFRGVIRSGQSLADAYGWKIGDGMLSETYISQIFIITN